MKTIIYFIFLCALIGCDLQSQIRSEVQGWLAESKAQRELLQKKRQDLEDKEAELKDKLEDDDLSPSERREIEDRLRELEDDREELDEREEELDEKESQDKCSMKYIEEHYRSSTTNLPQAQNFRGCDLRDFPLNDISLIEADFRDANLQGANFYCTDLRDADFRNSNLQDAVLVCAKIQDANFEGANIRDMHVLREQAEYIKEQLGLDNIDIMTIKEMEEVRYRVGSGCHFDL